MMEITSIIHYQPSGFVGFFDFGTQGTIFGTHSKVCYTNKGDLCGCVSCEIIAGIFQFTFFEY